MFLLASLAAAFLIESLNIKGFIHYSEIGAISVPTFTYLAFLTILLLNPFHFWYKKFRYELLYSLYNTVIAPFG